MKFIRRSIIFAITVMIVIQPQAEVIGCAGDYQRYDRMQDYIDLDGETQEWLNDLWKPYTYVKGDLNGDGELNIVDVVLLQEWLLSAPNAHLQQWWAADLCKDERINCIDLCLMKRELLYQ